LVSIRKQFYENLVQFISDNLSLKKPPHNHHSLCTGKFTRAFWEDEVQTLLATIWHNLYRVEGKHQLISDKLANPFGALEFKMLADSEWIKSSYSKKKEDSLNKVNFLMSSNNKGRAEKPIG
jgi:hypothetical protein